jgi:hypothetical protein
LARPSKHFLLSRASVSSASQVSSSKLDPLSLHRHFYDPLSPWPGTVSSAYRSISTGRALEPAWGTGSRHDAIS